MTGWPGARGGGEGDGDFVRPWMFVRGVDVLMAKLVHIGGRD